ncbi:MAG: lysophospholipid acyltransferase family protein [Desulfobacter sp.]|nr:lysophospholipid acyltransferase family protein [Desulfobacter sp.]MDD9305281.1 lysophospholipid acyltransferase family protein [Desulfobacter sp.]WDP88068.1 MAG: lysophospholipid acyltransferase family protein [Desulfobacter sp.]
MVKRLKFIIYTRPFIFFAYYLIRLYSLTFRLKVENEDQWMTLVKENHTVLLCTWHQQFFSAIRHFKTYSRLNPGLMISQSRDGDLISGVANRTGWHTPRGSSSRGGKQAMEAMIDHIHEFGFCAHILDGPRGPIGKVKPGAIKMALETDAWVVPFFTRADKAWFFNSWDRFMLPKPFSRVTLSFSQPFKFKVNPESDFESLRLDLETQMTPGLHI